jgi:hypothetical protein
MNTDLHKMWCIWTCQGEKQEVFCAETLDCGGLSYPWTESVNPDTQGWLDVALLFHTEKEAQAFDSYHNIEGYVVNVGDFLVEHNAI